MEKPLRRDGARTRPESWGGAPELRVWAVLSGSDVWVWRYNGRHWVERVAAYPSGAAIPGYIRHVLFYGGHYDLLLPPAYVEQFE